MVKCRMRSLGCSPCTGAIRSDADTIPKIIEELVSFRRRSARIASSITIRKAPWRSRSARATSDGRLLLQIRSRIAPQADFLIEFLARGAGEGSAALLAPRAAWTTASPR